MEYKSFDNRPTLDELYTTQSQTQSQLMMGGDAGAFGSMSLVNSIDAVADKCDEIHDIANVRIVDDKKTIAKAKAKAN